MTPLAPHLTAFLRERLPLERCASPHTCDAYAYAFQLLLGFAAKKLRARPSALMLEQLDVPLVLAFLVDLESTRGNSAQCAVARVSPVSRGISAGHGTVYVGVTRPRFMERRHVPKTQRRTSKPPTLRRHFSKLSASILEQQL